MRALAIALILPSVVAHAGGLATDGAYEVVKPPPVDEPVRGPLVAPVTLDVFVAVGHAPSLHAAELARRMVERAPLGDVREVLHVTPYGPAGADLAQEALAEAAAQGSFWPYCDRLLAERAPALTRVELVRLGREVGLDAVRLDEALVTRSRRAALKQAAKDGPNQPPGRILVNGRPVLSYPLEEGLTNAIAKARVKAQELLDAGVPLGRLYQAILDEERSAEESFRPLPHVQRPRVRLELAGAPSRGPSLAPVTIVVYSSLGCAACVELAQLARRVADQRGGAVRLVWKHWSPPYADTAAVELAIGAELQGRFWALLDQAVPSRGRANLGQAALEQAARRAGVDFARLDHDRKLGLIRKRLDQDVAELRQLNLSYSPALVVDGVVLSGLQSGDVLQRVIDEELDRGVAERLKPDP